MAVTLPSKNALAKLINGTGIANDNNINRIMSNDPDMFYQSGSDAVIEIENIVVDEMYDLQFSYREMKEPVYGYRSKHFDHVLPGTVLIQGQFTINYVHDQYLPAILEHSSKFSRQDEAGLKTVFKPIQETPVDYAMALSTFNQMRLDAEDAKLLVSQYKSEIKILESELIQVDKDLKAVEKSKDDESKSLTDDKQAYAEGMTEIIDDRDKKATMRGQMYRLIMSQYTKNALAIKDYNIDECIFTIGAILTLAGMDIEDEIIKDLIPTEPIDIKNDDEIIAYTGCNEQLKNQALSLMSPKWTEWPFPNTDALKYMQVDQSQVNLAEKFKIIKAGYDAKKQRINDDMDKLDKKIKEAQERIDSVKRSRSEIDSLYSYMEDSKNVRLENIKKYESDSNTMDIKKVLAYNGGTYLEGLNEGLAEDQRRGVDGFTISVSYHGQTNYLLFGCHITGHTDVIGLGGEPVKRYYTFIARGKQGY